jgi:processive 1,2-diacylglycerol beta-glucosyltransferase
MARRGILFMYASPASGHQKAAEAVINAMADLDPRIKCDGVDTVGRAHPMIGRIVSKMYIGMLKHTPEIWDFLYDNPTVEEATREIREIINLISANKVYSILKQYRPRCIVCTQAVPAATLASLKRRGKLKIPLVGIVTDYGVHSYWLSRHIDFYMVADEEIKRKMVRQGIRESHILVTGIPIDPSFTTRVDKSIERIRMGLDPYRPTILVMGGSRGLGPLADVVGAIRKVPAPHQVIAVAGNNKRIQKNLAKYFGDDPRVKILGFTKHMSRLMDASDILISKPGGLTTAECLAKGLPLIMFKPIPGQEEYNAKFIQRHGAGEMAETLDQLAAAVKNFLTHPDHMHTVGENARLIGRPYAAYECAQALLKILDDEQGGRLPKNFVGFSGQEPASHPHFSGAPMGL